MVFYLTQDDVPYRGVPSHTHVISENLHVGNNAKRAVIGLTDGGRFSTYFTPGYSHCQRPPARAVMERRKRGALDGLSSIFLASW